MEIGRDYCASAYRTKIMEKKFFRMPIECAGLALFKMVEKRFIDSLDYGIFHSSAF